MVLYISQWFDNLVTIHKLSQGQRGNETLLHQPGGDNVVSRMIAADDC